MPSFSVPSEFFKGSVLNIEATRHPPDIIHGHMYQESRLEVSIEVADNDDCNFNCGDIIKLEDFSKQYTCDLLVTRLDRIAFGTHTPVVTLIIKAEQVPNDESGTRKYVRYPTPGSPKVKEMLPLVMRTTTDVMGSPYSPPVDVSKVEPVKKRKIDL